LKIVFIDNFDSFTHNLIHYLKITGCEVVLYHHHELFSNQTSILESNGVVIGPGPNSPDDAGELMDFIQVLTHVKMPILGICLGQQAIGQFFGMNLNLAKEPMHGKTSEIVHHGNPLFKNIESPMKVGRYHSLVVEPSVNSKDIKILATVDQEIMSIQHNELPIWAVQFHPESVLTPNGQQLIQNWVDLLK